MSGAPFTHEAYRFMLRAAREAGYRFATFDELAELRRTDERACIVRHDCDYELVSAGLMARIEAEMGVRSTYFVMTRSELYNVIAPQIKEIVRGIIGLGHKLGLHFDELPYRAHSPEAVAEQVDRERAWLSQEFGVAIDAVSFHQPSARVLANEIRLNCLNTYDRGDMAGLHYLSDSNLRFRGKTPLEHFASGEHRLLHILLHPEWWTEVALPLEGKWNRMLANTFSLIQQSLLEREDAFNTPRAISIEMVPTDPQAKA